MTPIRYNITSNILAFVFVITIFSTVFLFTMIGYDSVFAHTKNMINKKNNFAKSVIEQHQGTTQSSICVTGLVSALECNNVNTQLGLNLGNFGIGQQ